MVRQQTDFSEPKVPLAEFERIRSFKNKIRQNISLGQYETGKSCCLQYLEIVEKYYGKAHPATLSALNDIGLLLKIAGDYADARNLYEKVLESYKYLFGVKHSSTIISMQNLAVLYKEFQETDRASLLL